MQEENQLVQEDHDQPLDHQNDEENCLIQKDEEKQVKPRPPVKSLVKKLQFQNYFSSKIQQMKKPEILLIVVALLLTMAWFEIICMVKHDHDQMKLTALLQQQQQQQMHSYSFIEVSHKKGQAQKTIQGDSSNQSNNQNQSKKSSKKGHHNKKKADNKAQEDEINWDSLKMITPLLDENEYKFMKLSNGIKVLIISDKNSPQSFAALDVRVGSWNEPIPGLAHFLEHMKFIATNEFTQTPNAFDNFLSNNQGTNNAYTENQHTNYHYTVSPIAFKESLKYFSYMFNKSQFEREFVMKEINAVNSEFVNTLTNDHWKIQYLINILAKKNHPASKFTCGSNETLISDKFDILKELDDFDKQNYSANLMSLVVYSNQSIEELQSFIEYGEFEKIPNFNKEVQKFKGLSIDEKAFGTVYKVKLLKTEYKTVYIYNQILDEKWNDRHDFNDYFSSVLKSSEKGTFYQRMKQLNYITNVEFGRFQRANEYTALMLGIDLTEDGYKNIDEIIRSYYVFVQEFKRNASKNNFEEMKNFIKIQFKYDSNDGINEDSISDFASVLNYLEKPNELFIQGMFKDFKEEEFTGYLEEIGNPKKHIIFIAGNEFDENVKFTSQLFDKIDNQYPQSNEYVQVDYQKILSLTQKQIKYLTSYDQDKEQEQFNFVYQLNLELAPTEDIQIYDAAQDDSNHIAKSVNLDSLNEEDVMLTPTFVDSSKEEYSEDPFTRKTSKSLEKFSFTEQKWNQLLEDTNADNHSTPIMLYNKDNIKSFIMLDYEKKEPQIMCQIKLQNKNKGILSKEQQVFQSIFFTSQYRFIEEKYSKAFESKYGLSTSSSINDIQFVMNGWDKNFGKVMKEFITTIQEYEPSQEEWEASQEAQILGIQAEVSEFALYKTLSKVILPQFIDDNFFPYTESIQLIEQSKLSDSEKYRKQMLSPTNIDILFSGNVSPTNVIEHTRNIKSFFDITELNTESNNDNNTIKIVNLSNKSYVYQQKNPNPEDRNSALINLYQIGERNIESLIYLSILSDKLDRFFFEYLRTKKALGYVAGAKQMSFGCVDYIGIVLQGEKKQPNEINKFIEKGFAVFAKQMNTITAEDFSQQLNSMRITYEMLPPSLTDKFNYMWNQIDREKYDFDIRYYILNTLENKITLEGYKQFYQDNFHKKSSKLSVQIYSQAMPFDEKDIQVDNYAKNLKETILINSKDDIIQSNEHPYFKCSYSI